MPSISRSILRMMRRLARHHRLELLIVVCAAAALVAVSQSTRVTARAFERSESWRHATGTLIALVSRSHVWLEELTAGDPNVDAERDVYLPLREARTLCAALEAGGESAVGPIQPVGAFNRARVAGLCDSIAELQRLTRERVARHSGAGTPIDARYDAVFQGVSAHGDLLGDELADAVAAERRRSARIDAGLLGVLFALFTAMALIGRRYVGERLARQQLEALALRDPLTGLANHRHFHERLHSELQRARRDGASLALIVLDLDHFKALNDSRGHAFGDRVLCEVAGALRAAVRESDLVARVAGEKFAVLLPGARAYAAVHAADGVRARIARLRTDGAPFSASAGVATFPTDAADAAALFEAADGALAWAKRDGRDRTRRYDPDHVRTRTIQQQREEIVALLDDPEAMRSVFQPLVALDTGDVCGYEALTRFPTVDGGPDRWFAQARRCGLGGPLEATAVASALAWRDRPAGCFVTVNLSPSGLLADDVLHVLPEDLTDVVVELTEHEAADAPELAGRLDELRRRGARIAVDDAGAGHAGLQQLMRVRPDIIKLDRALVDGVAGDPARAALIECFVAFARRTGAEICAEGIESLEDLRALAVLDVHYGQGYGLGRPAAAPARVAPEALRALRGVMMGVRAGEPA